MDHYVSGREHNMFDFKKEVNRFKPMTEVGDLENIKLDNEVQDVMDLLRLSFNGKTDAAKERDKKNP